MWSSDGAPALWKVTLMDGSVADVWADSVEGLSGPSDDRDYLFCNLIDVPPNEEHGFDVVGRSPANPQRVVVAVARFPRAAVRDVISG